MNILIVDDRKNDRLLLKKILTFHKYKSIEAKNGVEALRILRTSKIDLIISDILMPVMDGFRLLRELKKDDNVANIPFVFYSAHYVSDKDKNLALKLGASRFIIKPQNPKELLAQIEKVLNEKSAGLLWPKRSLFRSEEEYLNQYSQVIVRKLEEQIEEEERLYFQIIKAMAAIIEVTDPNFTYSHLDRVPVMAKRFGEWLELPPTQIKALEIAAYLHDIGKIIIPREVIKKRSLGKSDWDIIKEHPVVAYKILNKVQWPWPILEIVRHHHERFDGTGYPDHLKGADIPLTARLLAIIDAWDSMLHDQHYRPRLTQKKALSELKRCRGSMFDPFVVDKFIEMITKTGSQLIEPTKKRYKAA